MNNDEDEYDLSNGNELIKDLNLEIGSTKILRTNCCLHKVNICVRKAIKSNESLKKLLTEISAYVSQTRQVIK